MAWRGVKFPVAADETGVIGGESGAALIEDDIRQLLGTGTGERVRRPTFGTRLWLFIHDPLTAPTRQLIRAEIMDALRDWEPRIDVKDVIVSNVIGSQAVTATIHYVLIETGEDRVLDLTVSA
ncbi:GPW/gp25 family protein [Pyramidobacter piscolens]|uniref:GPW/gp25 family protein n=1 Tax=Pyramidobacter piscolens TaxID=638849 RepID=UPI002AB1DAC0|nr:GPW/gp25 family protein [Pyramidobacter piscolens]